MSISCLLPHLLLLHQQFLVMVIKLKTLSQKKKVELEVKSQPMKTSQQLKLHIGNNVLKEDVILGFAKRYS